MYIRKRGDSYRFEISLGYDDQGKKKRVSMSYTPPDGLTPKQEQRAVEDAAEQFERRVLGGSNVKYDKMRFREFAHGLYKRNHCNTLKAKTRRGYEIIIDTRLIPYFGEMYLRDITVLDVRKWLSSLERADNNGEKLSENSKGVWFRTLSAVLGKAYEWEMIDENPCKKIKVPRKAQSDVKALQIDDVRKLFEKLPECEDHRVRVMIPLLIYTGIREGECAGLEWRDFNFDDNSVKIERECIYVPGEGVIEDTPKSKAGIRSVFFPPVLSEDLRAYKAIQAREIADRGDLWTGAKGDHAKLFTTFEGAPLMDSTIRKWVKKYFKFAGVPYVTVHGLRHTNASLMISNGVDARTAAAQLGHSSPSLVMNTYANSQIHAQKNAAQKLGDLFRDA